MAEMVPKLVCIKLAAAYLHKASNLVYVFAY